VCVCVCVCMCVCVCVCARARARVYVEGFPMPQGWSTCTAKDCSTRDMFV